MLVVELQFLEDSPGCRHGSGDHVGEFAGDVEKAPAVVAHVEHEVADAGLFEFVDRFDEQRLRRRDVIAEKDVADRAGRGVDRTDVLYGLERDELGAQDDFPGRRRSGIPNPERVRFTGAFREEGRIQRGDGGGTRRVYGIHAVDLEHNGAACEIRRRAGGWRVRGCECDHDVPRRRTRDERPLDTVSRRYARLGQADPFLGRIREVKPVLGIAGRRECFGLEEVEVVGCRIEARVAVGDLVVPQVQVVAP